MNSYRWSMSRKPNDDVFVASHGASRAWIWRDLDEATRFVGRLAGRSRLSERHYTAFGANPQVVAEQLLGEGVPE